MPRSLHAHSTLPSARLFIRFALATVALAIATGCATTRPYLYNESKLNIEVVDSPQHAITYVRAYESDSTVVLYGKVQHRHGYCSAKGHIRLVVTTPAGARLVSTLLPLRQGNSKAHGWYGAAFRTRLERLPDGNLQACITAHDGLCDGATAVPSQ